MDVTINGKTYQVEAEPDTPLLWVIRDELGVTGTVWLRHRPVWCLYRPDRWPPHRSCVTTLDSVAGTSISQVGAISEDPIGRRLVEVGSRTRFHDAGIPIGQVVRPPLC